MDLGKVALVVAEPHTRLPGREVAGRRLQVGGSQPFDLVDKIPTGQLEVRLLDVLGPARRVVLGVQSVAGTSSATGRLGCSPCMDSSARPHGGCKIGQGELTEVAVPAALMAGFGTRIRATRLRSPGGGGDRAAEPEPTLPAEILVGIETQSRLRSVSLGGWSPGVKSTVRSPLGRRVGEALLTG